ncbi:alpha-2-macroglobulin family protein [Aliiroseovarius subalbicans]|uniref:alpha-2-macroglobulin family protein n=1 Tax=Aliiroseovarius subalbicans TaxID=2925840 RepID=UPI001F58F04F|nr:alpha-2-macroglobulin family protein [Aliiroseovarius subalbicans]MCI2399782.1 alpha-2-macroglobulin family protein [Aliiroseovarius subalbicans]
MRNILIFITFVLSFSYPAWAESPVPEKRVIYHRDVDFYGSDLQSIFDTSLRACQTACTTQADCVAFTFNTRSNSCFLKSDISDSVAYQGAFSAEVIATSPAVLSAQSARLSELSFLNTYDLDQAAAQARELPHQNVVGGWSAADLVSFARDAEGQANLLSAARNMAGAVVLTDEASEWLDYARLSLALRTSNSADQRKYRRQGLQAAINGFLRSDIPAQQANAFVLMSEALEALGRGRDMIPALRLAQARTPRDDTAAALDGAIGKYGFRVTDDRVDSDAANPRLCATFSEDLVASGVDYAPFVQADVSGLAVEPDGRQLCIEGVTHGQHYRVTLRAGLPAANGDELIRPVLLSLYVQDRSPSVHFPGRAYVLPRTADAGLPIVSVNARTVDLTLHRVSDRNLIRSFQQNYFGRNLDPWEMEGFADNVAQEVWTGTGEVQSELNRDVTTRLPMGEAIGDQPPGIYVLMAKIPGADPYDTPPATQWFVISDIGIATMLGADGLHVFTRTLGSALALEGTQLQLVSRANAVLGTAVTDAQGYAQFPAGLTAGLGAAEPALVVATGVGDDMAFLSLTEPAFDLSDRGVEGRPAAPPIDLFLTTDRGAYRAGEVIHATALTRDKRTEAIEGLPITAILSRPDGVEYARHLSTGVGAGGHVFAMQIGGTAPRGTWRLDLHADPEAPALASRTLLVEDFLPERIDFDLALPDGNIRVSDTPDVTLNARYLFGAPGADLAIEGDVRVRPVRALEAWPGYRFGHYDERPESEWGNLPRDQRTNAAGNAVLRVNFPDVTAPGMPLEAQLTLRVSEGSGRPVERNLTQVLTPDGPMIGIKPLFDGTLSEGSEAAFQLVALSPDLSPVEMPVSWALNRVQTRYQWYRLDGRWNWDPVTTRTRVASGDAMLGVTPANVAAPVDWGRYELVVERTGGASLVSATDFHAGWYGAADASTTPDMLELSLDRATYAPGDTATLRIVPRTAGKALVAVMSNRLIDMVPVDLVAGENTVTLPVTDDWGAGAYVTATLIQPMDAAQGQNPTRALGLTHASVDPGAHQLALAFDPLPEATPRGPMQVGLSVDGIADGEAAFVTIAAVDVGILNLTSFSSPDPSDHYFGQRRLGMGIRDLYGRLIDGLSGAMGAIRSGGDAMAEMRMQAPPPTEELMAQFSGLIPVENGRATTIFNLPEFNGTVRLMAVAWSATGVGQAEQDVLVRDPVVMTASLPRFLQPGDQARLLLELVHASGPAGDVQLSISANGVGVDTSSIPDRLTLAAEGTARLSVPVVAQTPGVHSVNLTLHTADGTRLTKALTLPVMALDPPTTRTSRFTLAAGQSFALDANVFDGLQPGSGKATLASGPLARINAPGLLETLDRYPYGCTEQLTSRALPLLYFGTVAEAMGLADRQNIPTRITDAISGVLANQSSAGSFGLWRPDSGDLWLDAYVSDFLSRARAQGYAVPDNAFRRAMDNLRNRVNYAADFDKGGQDIAYALHVLAREGAAAMGDLRYYADVKGNAFSTPLASAQLGAALAAYGDPARADRMFTRAARQIAQAPAQSQTWRDDYGTDLRDSAAVLALAVEAGSNAIDREALTARVALGDRFLSTQEATWSLLATNALIEDGAGGGLSVNGVTLTRPLAEVLEAQTATGAVDIRNDSGKSAELTLTTFGVPVMPDAAGGNGYTIERRYFTMKGQPTEVATTPHGTRLVTVVTVTPWDHSDGRLMVSDPLPAGFEIDNPHLLRAGDVKALDWLQLNVRPEMTEFRQDRFLAAVDWTSNKPFRLAYVVRAVTPGVFHHAAALVEDMYRPVYRANGATGQVRITE